MQALLKSRISQERSEIKRLMEMLMERGVEKKKPKERIHSPNEAEMTAMIQLVKENQLLEVCLLNADEGKGKGKGNFSLHFCTYTEFLSIFRKK